MSIFAPTAGSRRGARGVAVLCCAALLGLAATGKSLALDTSGAAPRAEMQAGKQPSPETITPSQRPGAHGGEAPLKAPLPDKARFESANFMRRLDLFIMEQSGHGPVAPGFAPESGQDLTLSLRSRDTSGEDGFLTLRDTSRPDRHADSQTGRPDFTSLYHPDGTVRDGLSSGRSGHSRLGLRFGDDEAGDRDVLSLSLESGYRLWSSLPGTTPVTGGPFASSLTDREVNLGLSVGYWGFNLDASVLRQSSPFLSDTSGFEAGLSYSSQSWAARLSMSEYRRGADLMGLENEARDIISVELGAVYRLTSKVGLTGSLRYYDYGDRVLTNIEAGEGAQMIFLGGRLEF